MRLLRRSARTFRAPAPGRRGRRPEAPGSTARAVLGLLALCAALAAAGACATGGGAGGRGPRPAAGGPPNLVVILADDLGWGDLGAYEQRLIRTPRLDRMAAEGARFRHFYSAAPLCPPARDALLTGRHTGHTDVRLAGVLAPDSPAAPRYLPRLLAGAGYVSGMFGKWGMGRVGTGADGRAEVAAGPPEGAGFAEFLGAIHHRDAQSQELPPFPVEPGDVPVHPRLWALRGGATREEPAERVPYTGEAYVAAALDFVRRHRDRPFFLYLPLTVPHPELYLPADDPAWSGYLDAAGESVFPETPWPGDERYRRPNPRPRATYAATITRLDRDVGRVLDLLDALGLAERTVVVFTADNGPHRAGGLGDPGFFDSTGGLAGWKGNLFEGGIRVPAVVRWPGTVAAGRVVDEPLALWDLLPTFLELAGVERPAGIDGLSFAPLLRGEPQRAHDAAAPLYWETFAGFRGQAVRLGRWKLMRRLLESADDHTRLVDVEADPGETTNLAARPELCPVYLELARLLNAARTDPGGEFSFPPLREECPAPGRADSPPPRSRS
jgi:arylsulfatase A-like enzyme